MYGYLTLTCEIQEFGEPLVKLGQELSSGLFLANINKITMEIRSNYTPVSLEIVKH